MIDATISLVLSAEPIVAAIKDADTVVLDCETSSLYPWKYGKVLAGLGVKPVGGPGFYIPFRHGIPDQRRAELLAELNAKLDGTLSRLERAKSKGLVSTPAIEEKRDALNALIRTIEQPDVNADISELIWIYEALRGKTVVMHNAKFDLAVIYEEGLDLYNVVKTVLCTMVTTRLVLEDEMSYELKALAAAHVDPTARDGEKALKRYIKQLKLENYAQVPSRVIANPYVRNDLVYCEQILLKTMKSIEARGLTKLLDLETRVTKDLFYLERNGVKIDVEYVTDQLAQKRAVALTLQEKCFTEVELGLRERWAARETWLTEADQAELAKAIKLFKESGMRFNVQSSDDLKAVFHGLGVRSSVLTKTGGESWDKNALAALAVRALDDGMKGLANNVVAARSALHIASYFENFLGLADDAGILHSSMQQAGAKTGRMSSREPNLQNIPTRDSLTGMGTIIAVTQARDNIDMDAADIGPEGVIRDLSPVRVAFVPRDGYGLLSADWSQIELRILAHYSQEPEWLRAYELGLDIHTLAAGAAYGPCPSDEQLAKWWRKLGKATNFGVVYGIGDEKLGKQIQRGPDVAGRFKAAYFKRFPRIRKFITETETEGKERARVSRRGLGYVEDLWGRRRYLPEEWAYRLTNFRIQGSSADFMKECFCRLTAALGGLRSKITNIVHDEFVLEVAMDEIKQVVPLVALTMTLSDRLTVPLKVDLSWSTTNWGELTSLECDTCAGHGLVYDVSHDELSRLLAAGKKIRKLDEQVCPSCGGRGFDLSKIEV